MTKSAAVHSTDEPGRAGPAGAEGAWWGSQGRPGSSRSGKIMVLIVPCGVTGVAILRVLQLALGVAFG